MFKDKKVTVIVSGGMDSVTLLYYILSQTAKENVKALSIDYGQKHKKELVGAAALSNWAGVDHKVVAIPEVQQLLVSSLTSEEEAVPEGHYAEENMKKTVVPNRNAIMLSIAYGYAISNQSDFLAFGAHAGDHFIYPDCRPLFVDALNVALQVGNQGFGNVTLVAPFSYKTKTEIAKLGTQLHVPYEKTWSCYKGGERPCLKCGTCIERYEAFNENDLQDPLLTDKEWTQAGENYNQAKANFESAN